MDEESKPDADDGRPPICPACGVTMGIVVGEDETTHYLCVECGFSDEPRAEAYQPPDAETGYRRLL